MSHCVKCGREITEADGFCECEENDGEVCPECCQECADNRGDTCANFDVSEE